jgi:hypothetical protein
MTLRTIEEVVRQQFYAEFPDGRIYLHGKSGAYAEMPHIDRVLAFICTTLSQRDAEVRKEERERIIARFEDNYHGGAIETAIRQIPLTPPTP